MSIAKADYFAGAFLTSILKSVDTVPVVCSAKGLTKCLRFSTEHGGWFYAYIKYSKNRTGQEGESAKWYIPFTEKEYVYLSSDFMLNEETKVVVMVCTDEKLSDTHICVLPIEIVLECLKSTSESGSRKIEVERIGSKHCYNCSGYDGVIKATPPFNHLTLFVSKEKKKPRLHALPLR